MEAGLNINYVAFHFDIHKTIAYRKINRFVQTKLVGDRPRSGRQTKKLTPLEERFIQITSRRVTFQTANLLCITSRIWNAKLTETRIFRELSIEKESSVIELKSSLIQLESSLIQLESSLIQLLRYQYNILCKIRERTN